MPLSCRRTSTSESMPFQALQSSSILSVFRGMANLLLHRFPCIVFKIAPGAIGERLSEPRRNRGLRFLSMLVEFRQTDSPTPPLHDLPAFALHFAASHER